MKRLLHPLSVFLFTLATIVLSAANALATTPTDAELRSVPSWAKEAVWYQIFPERFRNGDPHNDPKIIDMQGSWPHETPKQWHISSWTGDWYKLQPWETVDGKDFYYHAQQRRYGGDLQGIINKLDYLKKLGVNAIYLNPVFESPSLHKYDATMYHHIDNNFGPDPDGDRTIWEKEDPADPTTWKWTSADKLFLQLIAEAHRRKMYIIIDGVFNHVGMTFWALEDVKKKGEASLYKDWFTIKKFDNPSTPENEFEYEGWFGIRELPELREDENGIVAGPRAHIHAIVKRWMDPNGDGDPSDGIDGWRLDVAEMVAMPFWREFRIWTRSINPNSYTTGEVWWADWKNDRMFNAEPWLRGDAFDAVMNYRVAREAGYFFKGVRSKITASEFMKRLDSLRAEYRSDANYVLMNLFDSHDTDRLPSQIVNADSKYDKYVNPNEDRAYDVRKPNAVEIQTQKLMVLFQMTYVGAPAIYYGDEAGMWGADDPDERKPMLWPDMKYDNESSHPFGKTRPSDINAFDEELYNYYASCVNVRRSSKALSLGDISTFVADNQADVIAFKRTFENEHVVVLLNNSNQTQQIKLPESLSGLPWKMLLAMNNEWSQEAFEFELKPKSGMVLQAKGK